MEDFFGDTILVNGKVWPFLAVKRGKYRFRLLNGSNSRTYELALSNGATFHQIGTDGGLLAAPVPLQLLRLSPGERADLVLDFEPYAAGTEILLQNSAPAPYPGVPGVGVVPDVMKFVVSASLGHTAALPATLRAHEVLDEADAHEHRRLELRKLSDPCTGSTWLIDGLRWDDVTEFPVLGDTEVWSFVNRSGETHPMHMHLVMGQILDRQDFTVVDGEIVPVGPRVPPPPGEAGWKDTFPCPPAQITRVITRFEDYTGLYPYHCHILEHEDQEMMRQFRVTPARVRRSEAPSGPVRTW
jgi:spore coat protein A